MPIEEIMEEAARTITERNAIYGNRHIEHGHIMSAMFPDGIQLETPEDHSRFMLLTMIIGKINRYANNFHSGGHRDSIHDAGNFCHLLEAEDERINNV